jgi:imidazolonepropionase-like amidohydrolase
MRTVIDEVALFDGEELRRNVQLVMEGSSVVAIGPRGAVAREPDDGWIEGAGATVLPGLVDCHTHVYWSALTEALLFGVTVSLDMFSDHVAAATIRSRQRDRIVTDEAELLSAGTALTAPGGHGTQYGFPIPTITPETDIDEFVAARVAEGSDYIKIIVEGGKPWNATRPTLDADQVRRAAAAAHAHGKLAVAHVGSHDEAMLALEAGVDGLAHAFADRPPDARFAALAAERGAFVIPTLTVLESTTGTASGAGLTREPEVNALLTAMQRESLRAAFPRLPSSTLDLQHALDAVAQLRSAGVDVLAGSDAPNPGTAHGVSIHRELELLVLAGLSPTEALKAATSIPARRFKLDGRGRGHGRVDVGGCADIVLVTGDPTADIRATRAIVAVWKGGTRVDRDRVRERIAVEDRQLAGLASMAPPAGSESGLVADFSDGTLSTSFGSGIVASTDQIVGGASTVSLEVRDQALVVTGRTGPGTSLGGVWAGAMFNPGTPPFAPANLTGRSALHLVVRGDGSTYTAMSFTAANGAAPAGAAPFRAPAEWTAIDIPLSSLNTNGVGVLGLAVYATAPETDFHFEVNEISLR